MTRGRSLLPLAVAACATVLALGGATRMTAAAYTANLTVAGSSVTVDSLANHFHVTPGSFATGDVDSLAVDLGLVAAPGTVTDVFTVTNADGEPRTATLTLQGPAQVASVVFAGSGTSAQTLAPGATATVSVTTSATTAGRGSGSIKLSLGGSSWLYRAYPLTLDAAPSAPASVTAVPQSGGRIALSWAASATVDLAGYDVYRSSGGAHVKLNASPLAGTSYTDAATTDGTAYSYKVRAISTGAPALASGDSPVAVATADATAPVLPSALQLANGGGQGSAWINLANRASISVSVQLPSTSLSSDTLTVTLSNAGGSVSKTAAASAGAGTVTVTGLNGTSLADGNVTISATTTDAAGNVSAARTSAVQKDTVAPGAPTATYTDANNGPDQITGTAEAGSTVSAAQTAPSSSGPYTGTATGGSYTLVVARVDGRTSAPITVTYLVTASDAAGNTSSATTLTFADKR